MPYDADEPDFIEYLDYNRREMNCYDRLPSNVREWCQGNNGIEMSEVYDGYQRLRREGFPEYEACDIILKNLQEFTDQCQD